MKDATHTSELFLNLFDKIAAGFGMPGWAEAKHQAVFNALGDMASFDQKGPVCKFETFMSLQESWVVYKKELWGNKLILTRGVAAEGHRVGGL